MELLQLIISFLSEKFKDNPVFNSLGQNFDFQNLLSNIDFEKLLPFLMQIINSRPNYEREFETKPIINIADKDIVYSLNRYFYSLPD